MANSKSRWEAPNQWDEWSQWLAAGLHARNRWRLPVLLLGILFAGGRRTVTIWLRAAGVSDDFQDYYYFLAAVGRKTNSIATPLVMLILRTLPLPERLLLVIDDSPTKRYGPKVEGADVHHNPTPGPADQPFLYGHRPPLRGGARVAISLALRHPTWGPIGLPLLAMLYVRKRTMATIPKVRGWQRFATKLQLAARLANHCLHGLWRGDDQDLQDFPGNLRASRGLIRVVLVKEDHGWYAFFCTDPNASVKEILEAFADRATIEQDFHDVKEVWGSGQQQVRNIWTNLAVYNLNLWMHTLIELWAWRRPREQLCDRSDSPWDDALRRPSHANRRKALRQHIIRNELSTITAVWRLPRKIIQLAKSLMALTA